MPTYRISGLTVVSDVPLPGVPPIDAIADDADVRIAFGRTPEQLEHATSRNVLWEIDERRFLWRLPEIGRFLVTDGTTLDVEPASERSASEVLPFLLGTGMGAVLYQRGRLPLHASAVALDGRAIVICAPSGVGKSTLAAALCGTGCEFVCDDVAALDLDVEGRPIVWADGRSLKLLDRTIDDLDLRDAYEGEVRAGVGKHYVAPRNRATTDAMPLHAIYMLRDAESGSGPSVMPMTAIEAAQMLLHHSYRRRLGLANAQWRPPVEHTAAVLRHARISRFTRPRDMSRLEESIDALLAHARSDASGDASFGVASGT